MDLVTELDPFVILGPLYKQLVHLITFTLIIATYFSYPFLFLLPW